MANLKVLLSVLAALLCLFVSTVNAEMFSTNFRITSSVISGGGNVMSSTNHILVSTLGQPTSIGKSSSINYGLDAGFLYTILLDTVGDVNGDGVVNLKDVIAALQVVTGQSPVTIIEEADADGDGKIGVGEAIMILKRLGGI